MRFICFCSDGSCALAGNEFTCADFNRCRHRLYSCPDLILPALAGDSSQFGGNPSPHMPKSEPCNRMAADAAIAFSDIGPVDVLSQVQKDSNCALVGTLGQLDLITLAKPRMGRFEL
jgi:hypothetical protein